MRIAAATTAGSADAAAVAHPLLPAPARCRSAGDGRGAATRRTTTSTAPSGPPRCSTGAANTAASAETAGGGCCPSSLDRSATPAPAVLPPPPCAVWPAATRTGSQRDCPALGGATETATAVIHSAALDASTADECSMSSQDDAVSKAVTGRVTEVPHRPTTELDIESTASQQTGGDDDESAGFSPSSQPEPPTTHPGFTPLYRRVRMTRAQAYARLTELQLGKLPRPHGAATPNKHQPRPAQRPPASPDADDVAHAFTPLYHCTFRKAPAPDRRPL